MDIQELAAAVTSISKLNGNFLLRSGQTSDIYFDKYQFEADPNLLREIAKAMAPMIPSGTELLAGLELGGVPIATTLSLETGIPTVFVRKEKKEYGTAKLAEGPEIDGKKVSIVEDVITTGGQVLESTDELRSEGAVVSNVLAVILRANEQPESFEASGLELRTLFTAADLGF